MGNLPHIISVSLSHIYLYILVDHRCPLSPGKQVCLSSSALFWQWLGAATWLCMMDNSFSFLGILSLSSFIKPSMSLASLSCNLALVILASISSWKEVRATPGWGRRGTCCLVRVKLQQDPHTLPTLGGGVAASSYPHDILLCSRNRKGMMERACWDS